MGIKEERDEVVQNGRKGSHSIGGRGGLGGNGMRDVWVIGEGFFRGVGGVFDVSCYFNTSYEAQNPNSLKSSRSIESVFEHTRTAERLGWVGGILEQSLMVYVAEG
jgi:hypothetical protein